MQISWKGSKKRDYAAVRILTNGIAFKFPGELFFASILLYHFRLLERQMGSRRFGIFVAFVSILGYLQQAVLYEFGGFESATGLYPVLYASFLLYFLHIPPLSAFKMFGMNLTDKSFIYLTGAKLLSSISTKSFVAGLCGLLPGLVYDFFMLR